MADRGQPGVERSGAGRPTTDPHASVEEPRRPTESSFVPAQAGSQRRLRRFFRPSVKRPGQERRTGPGQAEPGQAGRQRSVRSRLPHPGFRLPFPRIFPRTFQGRLSLAFILVFAVAVGVVSIVTVVVLDRDLRQQEELNLAARTNAVADVIRVRSESIAGADPQDVTVVSASGKLNSAVAAAIGDPDTMTDYANNVAQADLRLRFGLEDYTPEGYVFVPATEPSTFAAGLTAAPGRGQARDQISYTEVFNFPDPKGIEPTWDLEVSLSAPYTTRASTIASVIEFLLIAVAAALLLSTVVAAYLARRFTQPIRRLTDAARGLAEGDLTKRVPADNARSGGKEILELSRQFNTMADQLEESMDEIRRDRDTGREFLADVSHELRTPLAALRTFNELLREKAGADAEARAEFLESSGQQIERLDWLAQNLLELSKLDSGLVRLDLRPEDMATTVQSAVEQAQVSATRRGVELTCSVPDRPLVIRHDPQRMGQVLSNLIGNALKFTPRGGTVRVTLRPHARGARIQVVDTGVGIDAAELPKIFDRFYRGSRASEARSSGSGLGLAIVRSVVDMHAGRIMVESRIGAGTTFTVTLPADPRSPDGKVAGDGSRSGPSKNAAPAGTAKGAVQASAGASGTVQASANTAAVGKAGAAKVGAETAAAKPVKPAAARGESRTP